MSPLLRSLQLFSGIAIWLIYNEIVELWRRLGMLAVRDEALIDSYVFSAFPVEPLHCKIISISAMLTVFAFISRLRESVEVYTIVAMLSLFIFLPLKFISNAVQSIAFANTIFNGADYPPSSRILSSWALVAGMVFINCTFAAICTFYSGRRATPESCQ